jgi:hypothetical protein
MGEEVVTKGEEVEGDSGAARERQRRAWRPHIGQRGGCGGAMILSVRYGIALSMAP